VDPSLNVNVSSPVCEPWISLKQWGHHQWDHLGQAVAVVGQHQAFCVTWNLPNCWIHMEVSIGGTPIFWKVQVDGGWWVLMLIADDYAWCFMMVNNCYWRLWPTQTHNIYIYMDMHHISNKWSSWISIDQMIITIVTFNIIGIDRHCQIRLTTAGCHHMSPLRSPMAAPPQAVEVGSDTHITVTPQRRWGWRCPAKKHSRHWTWAIYRLIYKDCHFPRLC
jgi:hypothetical protein